MARIRTRVTPWPDKFDIDNYKDCRRGALDDAFWDEDELVDYVPSTKRKKPKKKRGCPENDFGPHIYVWVPQPWRYDWWPEYVDRFYEKNGFHRREYQTCCGCEKINGSRYTEEMQRLISKKGWYKANYGD